MNYILCFIFIFYFVDSFFLKIEITMFLNVNRCFTVFYNLSIPILSFFFEVFPILSNKLIRLLRNKNKEQYNKPNNTPSQLDTRRSDTNRVGATITTRV